MKEYTVIVSRPEIVRVQAESEEQAIAMVRSKFHPTDPVDIQVAIEVALDEETKHEV